jgi:hypothetical protein
LEFVYDHHNVIHVAVNEVMGQLDYSEWPWNRKMNTMTHEVKPRNFGDMSEEPEVAHNPTIAEYYEQYWKKDDRHCMLIGTIHCNFWQIYPETCEEMEQP